MATGAADSSEADLPRFGRYRIQELLGQGGMGVVHRAYDTVNGRVIALKRLPGTITDRDFRARFQRESRIVAGLRHPNVIPVNDFGEVDGDLFLDMKLVEGTDLRRMMGTGALEHVRTIRILAQVAAALDAAHAKGLVHRDVKPSNILIDAQEHAYLADFGIAREMSADATVLTRSGDLVGTWDYMAPERMSSGRVDGRSDQYSLACVLFECLTGRLAHPAADPAAKVAAHLLQPPPAPSVFSPTITPALDAVVMRGMAKDPARRFPSASEMMAAAQAAVFDGATARSAQPTAAGPSKEADQGKLVRAILRSTAPRRRATLPMGHDKPPTSPYPGLIGFDSSNAHLFHGRDHVVTDLLVRLAEQLDTGEPVVLVGASGAGKSSVLHAGLLPVLAAVDEPWPQIVITPGADPIRNLATALAAHSSIAAAEWARAIVETPARVGALCARAMASRPAIVVDQFEELFTHGTAEADRLAFATALANASPALVVLAVRADLVDRCIELTPLLPALNSPVLLGSMNATDLRQAIVQPARDYGVDIEPGLPERLIADLGVRGEMGYDPGALPRLAHALREAWNYREGDVLTLAAYRKVGGIDGAVSRTAEDIYAQVGPDGQHALRTILLRLVTVFDDGGVARRRVSPEEVAGPILDSLIRARLVTVDEAGARLSHEALLTAWPRLRDWIDEDRAGLIQHRRFTDAVQVWNDSGQQPDDLYRGARLAALTAWLESARDRVRLRPAEEEFLARSNAAEYAGQIAARRRTRRLRVLVAALSVLLLVASGAVVVATQLRQNALDERGRADLSAQLNLSRRLAVESTLAVGIDPRRTAMLALGAWQASETAEARSALLGNKTDHYRGVMTGHTGPISSVAISADGKIAASGGRDGTLRLWDVPSRKQLAVLDDKGAWYRTVSMSADGKLLAAASVNKSKVSIWSIPERKLLFEVRDPAVDVVLSRDGNVVAVNAAGAVSLWDTRTQAQLARFKTAGTLAMTMSGDGSLIAMSTKDNKAEVYRVADGAVVATLTGHTADITGITFSPDGKVLATGSMDRTVRLWDTAQWTTTQTFTSSEGGFSTVVFSPQGTSLIAGGIGTTLYAWDLASGDNLLRLATGSVTTFGLAISGDGHTFISASSEGVLTVWAYQRVILGAREASVTGVAFQPNGKLLATITGKGTVSVWDSTNGDRVRQWQAHNGEGYDVTFSPDGKEIATVGADGALVIWKTDTGAELRRFTRPGAQLIGVVYDPKDGKTIALAGRSPVGPQSQEDFDEVVVLRSADLVVTGRRRTTQEQSNPAPEQTGNHPVGIAYSPDGRTLAVSMSGGKVGLWNMVDPGAELTILPGHQGIALDAEFSPDGATLATSGSDRVVRLWRVRDGQLDATITGHDAAIRRVTFSPDGKVLATASQDTIVRLWDVRTRLPLARLDRHEDQLNDVAFDSTGQLVASGGSDGTTRVWDINPDHAVRQLCGELDRDKLADEWNALGPDRGVPPTCPN
jgi:WD40 repeat protein/serine/threonine protein kinase